MSAYFDAYRPFRQYQAMNYTMPYGYENNMYLPAQETDRETEQDMEYLMEMYPDQMKKVQRYVEEECDRNDYEGSGMYDEYPDRVQLGRICDRIYDRMQKDQAFPEEMELEISEIVPEEEPEEGISAMQNHRRRNPFLRDIVSVLLFNEMHRRRRRHRHGRRWS